MIIDFEIENPNEKIIHWLHGKKKNYLHSNNHILTSNRGVKRKTSLESLRLNFFLN